MHIHAHTQVATVLCKDFYGQDNTVNVQIKFPCIDCWWKTGCFLEFSPKYIPEFTDSGKILWAAVLWTEKRWWEVRGHWTDCLELTDRKATTAQIITLPLSCAVQKGCCDGLQHWRTTLGSPPVMLGIEIWAVVDTDSPKLDSQKNRACSRHVPRLQMVACLTHFIVLILCWFFGS